MTLHLVISSPNKDASYGARIEVVDRVQPAPGAADEFTIAQVHNLDPGQSVDLSITDTRSLRITEYHIPKIQVVGVTPDSVEEKERIVTLNEDAHGHE